MGDHSVEIYTDGACRGNPGPGGWGAVLIFRDRRKELKGAVINTTNNRMEITAAIRALSALKYKCKVALFTDSQYLRQGITEWMPNWKRQGWRTSKRTPVKNVDLWQQLDAVVTEHDIEWHWVKAHTGNIGNERADELANEAIDELSLSA